MNHRDPDNESLDPLARRLLELDEAFEHGLPSAGETARAGGDTADVDRHGERPADCDCDCEFDSNAEQCLQLIEAIRVIRPNALADAFDLSTQCGAQTTAASDSPETTAATHLGRFRLIRQLGQGGYGVVFLAHDPMLGREVALKVPRPEVLVTSSLRKRFLREAEAAAALDHRNIVPVYEAGSVGPICYIASAYCAGGSLSQWLHDQGKVVAPRMAASLIATLSLAVQHAHDRGVLHRDIKPSNVLIDGDGPLIDSEASSALAGRVRLADFGLARVIFDSQAGLGAESAAPELQETITAGIVGTPAYMAPEQAASRHDEISQRTDVYALGATLYHFLTGKPPIVGSSQIETLSAILSEDPLEPHRHQVSVPRDLSAICMKAICKEPEGRYQSASELEADLNRFLDGHQVQARPISRIQRSIRWCKRNPRLAALTSTASVSVVSALIIALAGWWSTTQALRREQMALDTASEAYQETKTAINDYYVTISENRLLHQPGMTPLRHELLNSALDYYRRFAKRYQNDTEAGHELQATYVRIGKIQGQLGDLDAAQLAYGDALSLIEGELTQENEKVRVQELRYGKGTVLRQLAWFARRSKQAKEADRLVESSLAIHRALIGEGFRIHENQHQIAQLLSAKGNSLQRSGDFPAAQQAFCDGAALVEKALQYDGELIDTDKAELRFRLAQLRGNEAIVMRLSGHLDASNRLLESVEVVYEALVEEFPDVPTYRENLGKAYAQQSLFDAATGDLEAALVHLRDATDAFDALSHKHPQLVSYQMLRASTRKEAAKIAEGLGRWEFSEQKYLDTIEILEHLPKPQPASDNVLADTRLAISRFLVQRGEYSGADAYLNSAADWIEDKYSRLPEDWDTCCGLCQVYTTRAQLHLARREFDAAISALDKGSAILEPLTRTQQDNPAVRFVLHGNQSVRSGVLEKQGDLSAAIESRQCALQVVSDTRRAMETFDLAALLAKSGEVAEAERLVSAATCSLKGSGLELVRLARAHAVIATAYVKNNTPDAAQVHQNTCIRLLEEAQATPNLPRPIGEMLKDDSFGTVVESAQVEALVAGDGK